MENNRVFYRIHQFWDALWAKPKPEQLDFARKKLTTEQFELFQLLQPSEQRHALLVAESLLAQGDDDPDLLTAALLHDIGKAKHPLRIWERVIIVLAQNIFPQKTHAWGAGEPKGWRRAFVIAAQHPVWGAEMVAETGTSLFVLEMIRCHQDEAPDHFKVEEKDLFAKLKAVDNNQ